MPRHAMPTVPCSSIALVVGPAFTIQPGGAASAQLTPSTASRCSQPATRPHHAMICAVPCSNLEFSSRRVVKTVVARDDGKAPIQSGSCSIRSPASFASNYSSPCATFPSPYHSLASPDAALPPRSTPAPSVRTQLARLGPPPNEPPPRLGPW